MEDDVLRERFSKIHNSQGSIISTADYLIQNSHEAKNIVKTWNEEFRSSSLSKKLTLLYLANDVLQRCSSRVFHSGFAIYLPKATIHLYKHGDEKIRAAVSRLIDVWIERKVLKSNLLTSIRSQMEKTKDSAPAESKSDATTEDVASQATKQKRDIHPLVEGLEEVEETTKPRVQMEKLISELRNERDYRALSKYELLKLSDLSDRHCSLVKSEIQVRKKVVDLFKEILNEQEEGLRKSKEALRLCFVRQEEIKKAAAEPLPVFWCGSASISVDSADWSPADKSVSALRSSHSFNHPFASSLVPPYQIPYPSHDLSHPINPAEFPVIPADRQNKPPEPGLYHQGGTFLRPQYVQGTQPALQHYNPHMMQGIHPPYGSQIDFRGFPDQYGAEKEWGP